MSIDWRPHLEIVKVWRKGRFWGAGHGLLTYSIALSYSLGFSGRVNLIPVANEDFYTERGFLPTNVTVDEDIVFEIPADQAIGLLQKRGLDDA